LLKRGSLVLALSQIQKAVRLSLFLLEHAGKLKNARNFLLFAMTKKLFLQRLKPALAKTKKTSLRQQRKCIADAQPLERYAG
jgi:hypothetical protein